MIRLRNFVILVLSLLGEVIAKPMEDYDRMLLRQQMDLDGATSYVYRSDNNGPVQIYYLTGDGLNKNFPTYKPTFNEKSREVIPYVYSQPYASAYPITYYPPEKKSELVLPIARASSEINTPIVRSEYIEPSSHSSSEEYADYPSDDSSSSSYESGEGGRDYSGSNESGDSKGHLKEGGQSHEEKFNKKHGKNSKKGYKKEFKFSKGDKGSYSRENNNGEYDEEGGKKASHYDGHDNHSEHDSAAKNEKGGKFEGKKHHKKGSKSKGYHNVFMKDEYKKDHTFYDTADHQGEYSKHGSNHKEHHDEEGEKKKGSHYESASNEDHSKKKGGSDKGNYDKHDEGHKEESGHEKKFSHHEKHAKKGEKDHHSEHADESEH